MQQGRNQKPCVSVLREGLGGRKDSYVKLRCRDEILWSLEGGGGGKGTTLGTNFSLLTPPRLVLGYRGEP